MSVSTLDKILEAATELFAQKGFAGSTVEEIAARAKVNKAALYYHVGNKEVLYERVLSDNLGTAADRLETALDKISDARDAVRTLVRELSDHFAHRPYMPRIMVQELARGGERFSPLVLGNMARLIACTTRVVTMAARQGGTVTNPLAMHLSLVSSLAVYHLSTPLRQRASALPLAAGLELELSPGGMAGHLENMFMSTLFPHPEATGDSHEY